VSSDRPSNVFAMWPLASSVLRSAWTALQRFPGPLLAAATSAALLIDQQHRSFRGDRPLVFVLSACIGLPLGIALTLFAEHPPNWLGRGRFGKRWFGRGWFGRGWFADVTTRRACAFVLTLILVGTYAAVLHGAREQGEGYQLRYAQLSLAAHLAVAFAPFLGRGPDGSRQTRAVWQLGRRLFLRLPLAGVYALVVFGGLALALAALVHLFGVRVDDDRYFELWVCCTFVLQTWIFLAGIPRDFTLLDQERSYPTGLRVFSQFVLLPLLALYLGLLYAYAGKIVLSGSLPSGWVGWMVSAAGAFGMLSLLLLFPARNGPLGRFVRRVETGFHLAILPLLGLLFVSLAERVGAYGITERRYFLFVLGVWLAAASLYRLRWGRTKLAWIPISLCLLALLTSFGPWGALSVSRESQSARLTALLERSHRLSGRSQGSAPVAFADRREMSRILDYLIETHGKGSLRRWPGPSGASDTAASFLYVRNLDYIERYAGSSETLSLYGRADAPIDVHGYDWLVPFTIYEDNSPRHESSRFTTRLAADGTRLEVLDQGKLRGSLSLTPAIEELEREHPMAKEGIEPIIVSGESGGLRVRVVLTHLQVERRAGRWAITSGGGSVLIEQ